MEKGFNDDELADIMNEIESLEKEFASEDKQEIVESPEAEEERVSSEAHVEAADREEETLETKKVDMAEQLEESQEEMSEVLGELSKMAAEEVVPQNHGSEESNVKHLSSMSHESEKHSPNVGAKAGGQTAMSFHVEGDMKFELSFHIGDKFVGLTVTEEGLEIGLDGGAKFTLPVDESFKAKKAS